MHQSKDETVATNNTSEIDMDSSYLHLISTYAWQPWLVQGMENKPINVPVPLNKCGGHKRSYKEIKEEACLQEPIQQPPTFKKHHSEDLDSKPDFPSWKVPLCVPCLPSTGPTYINAFAESIFMPSLFQPNTFSNLPKLEFKPDIPECNYVSDLQINTNSYIQHLQNVFVKAYEFPNDLSESISIDSLLDDSVTEDIDLSKDMCDPIENTRLLTNPFIDVTVSRKIVSYSVENFITHLIEDSVCKEESLIVKTTKPPSDHISDALGVSKDRFISEEATRHLPNPISEDMVIIKEESLSADIANVITRFNSARMKVKCEICHKKQKNKYRLKVHMETHKGKYPHFCEICNKGFERSSTLYSHRMRLHPIPISQLSTV